MLVDAHWLLAAAASALPAGAWVGWLVYTNRSNALYTRSYRDGWQARIRHEREQQAGRVHAWTDDDTDLSWGLSGGNVWKA